MKTLSFAAIALALSVSAASAQDFVQAQIDSLFAQGYTHFTVRRGVLNSSVEAYSPTGLETTVVLDNSTGDVVSQTVESTDAATVAGTIQEIEQRHLGEVGGSDDVMVEVTTATGETVYVEADDHGSNDDSGHVGGSDNHSGGYDDSGNDDDHGSDHDSNDDDSNDDHDDDHGSDHDDD